MMTTARVLASARNKTGSNVLATLLLYTVLGVVCLFSGLLIGSGQGLIVVLLMALVMSVVLLAYPVPLMWAVLLGALVVSGPAEVYFPELRQLRWGVSILGFALIGSAVLNHLFLHRKTMERPQPANATMVWLGVFFAVALAGILYTRRLESLIGIKSYFQACGFFLTLAWLSIDQAKVDRLMKSLVVIALIQLPFALHQFFFMGAKRISATSGAIVADGVVGTFPGSATGGGAGPVLSALLILVICILIFWWRHGRLGSFKALAMVGICLIPVFLNETKISLILIPISLYLVFADKLRKNPLQFLAGSIMTVLFLAGMFMVYINLPAGSAYVQGDASISFKDAVAYNVGDKGYGLSELNRTTVYTFWAQRHGLGNLVETMVGHGLGSAGEGGKIESSNLASVEYRGKGIGLTAISAMLWDVGLLGTLAVLAMFWSAFTLSGRLLVSSRGDDIIGDGLLMGARVGIAILGLNLVHNNYFCFEFGYQTLVMLMFGYVAYRARNGEDQPPQAQAAAPSRKSR